MKHPMKWASVAATLLLAACGVKYLPALWSTQFAVLEAASPFSSTITRELADGSIRVAYQRDRSTLVVDTYDSAGNLLEQDEFESPGSEWPQYDAIPLFASDDVLYWFGQDDQRSMKIDLASNTMQPLSDLLTLDLGEAEAFEFGDAILLENGQLVLAGGDRFASSSHPTNARVVVMDADGSVQTVALESHQPFTNLVARSGTDQYLVQSFEGNLGFPILLPTTYLGDSNVLVEQPQILHGAVQQADQNGAWVTQIGGSGLFRYNAALELAHQDDSLLAMKIQPTSDQNYLMLHVDSASLRYVKTDSTGNVLWEIPASANTTPYSGLTESNGKILLSETTRKRIKSTLVQDSDPAEIIPVSKVTAKVRHRLLDADGKELARFSEPDYKATLERNPTDNTDGSALEFTAGSCEHTQALLLSNGDFVTLSRWCTEHPAFVKNQQTLQYFEQP